MFKNRRVASFLVGGSTNRNGPVYDGNAFPESFATTKIADAVNWARKYSFFTYPFVTACCGMEYFSVAGPRYDIDRFYLARQPIAMDPQDEGVKPLHGDVTLLNKKATRYPEFSYQMLNRTLPVAEKSAAAKLNGQQLPGDLERVILTATLTPTGRLSDIAIEQHSGVAAVDHIMIDACKQGLWAMNPPAEAAGPDKNYRVHFEGVIYNYSFDRHGQYSYITHIGVGLL